MIERPFVATFASMADRNKLSQKLAYYDACIC
jgi:hypothetical protein